MRPSPTLPDEAFVTLGLTRDAGRAEVQASRRRLAFAHHPDRGGSAERLQLILEAAEVAARHVVACPVCGGKGQLVRMVGFTPLYSRCDDCEGDGRKK